LINAIAYYDIHDKSSEDPKQYTYVGNTSLLIYTVYKNDIDQLKVAINNSKDRNQLVSELKALIKALLTEPELSKVHDKFKNINQYVELLSGLIPREEFIKFSNNELGIKTDDIKSIKDDIQCNFNKISISSSAVPKNSFAERLQEENKFKESPGIHIF
jgi:hypothetical protein